MPGGVPLLPQIRSVDAVVRRLEAVPAPPVREPAQGESTVLEARLASTLAELLAESKRSAGMILELEALKRELLEMKAELAARIAIVPRYVGVFKEGTTYRVGEMVTDRGSVFHCRRSTTVRPSTCAQMANGARPEGLDWALAVRRGSDGRDWDHLPRAKAGARKPGDDATTRAVP